MQTFAKLLGMANFGLGAALRRCSGRQAIGKPCIVAHGPNPTSSALH
jgi:hypothetical protein